MLANLVLVEGSLPGLQTAALLMRSHMVEKEIMSVLSVLIRVLIPSLGIRGSTCSLGSGHSHVVDSTHSCHSLPDVSVGEREVPLFSPDPTFL